MFTDVVAKIDDRGTDVSVQELMFDTYSKLKPARGLALAHRPLPLPPLGLPPARYWVVGAWRSPEGAKAGPACVPCRLPS